MEVVIGEGQSSFNMEEVMAWRDQEDKGFRSEFQGVDRKRLCSHVRSILQLKILKFVSIVFLTRVICAFI